MDSIYISLLFRILLVLGGFNYLLVVVLGKDYIQSIPNEIVSKVVMFAIGLSAAWFMFERNYYLPFLGKCVIPVVQQENNIKRSLKVNISGLPPNVNVLYWAAKETKTPFTGYQDAYGDYSNSGLAQTTKDGNVTLDLVCPGQYSVSKFGMFHSQLPRHVHYRYELPGQTGMFSQVYTYNIKDEC